MQIRRTALQQTYLLPKWHGVLRVSGLGYDGRKASLGQARNKLAETKALIVGQVAQHLGILTLMNKNRVQLQCVFT